MDGRLGISNRGLKRRTRARLHSQGLGPRPCSTRQEGDERACHCGLRWSTNEERPECKEKMK